MPSGRENLYDDVQVFVVAPVLLPGGEGERREGGQGSEENTTHEVLWIGWVVSRMMFSLHTVGDQRVAVVQCKP